MALSSFLCCLPLGMGLVFAVLLDLAATAFFGLALKDAKDGASDGYEHLWYGLAGFAGVSALAALVGLLAFLEECCCSIGLKKAYSWVTFFKILCGIALVVVAFVVYEQEVCFEAKAVKWTFGYTVIRADLDCDWVLAIVCAPVAAVTLISLYTFAVVRSANQEDQDAAFRVPLLHDEKGATRSNVQQQERVPSSRGGVASALGLGSASAKPSQGGAKAKAGKPDDQEAALPHSSLSPRARANLGMYDNFGPEPDEEKEE